jgi:peptidyl-prolyl cis-trans isomerase B (cyclophilin B)
MDSKFIFHRLVLLFFVLSLLIVGELRAEDVQLENSIENKEANGSSKGQEDKLPFAIPTDTKKLPEYALIVTNKGPFEIKIFRDLVPVSSANLKYLVEKGIYEGVKFHRYVPGFVLQGGDPTGTTIGGPGWSLPPEMHPDIKHVRGTIGWARTAGKNNPERRSNASQFYICLEPQPRLDGFYSPFGVVVDGMDTVLRLRPGDKILKIKFPKEYLKEAVR